MRRWVKIVIIAIVLLAVGAVVCALRWQAWFGVPAEPVWTGETRDFTFRTFAQDSLPGFCCDKGEWTDTHSPENLEIIVLGDIHNHLQREDYDSLAVRVPQADAIAQVGDWLDRGQGYYRQLLLREWAQSALCGLPVITCPGNHEYSKGLTKTLSGQWQDCFPQPSDSIAVPGVFYHIDFPGLRFIVIDSNPLERLVYRTRTLTWLRTLMNSADGRYIVVMMHHPVLSAGKGRFNSAIYSFFRVALSQTDLTLCGHDHSYMRYAPFVVLNTAGTPKQQKSSLAGKENVVVSDEPVYSVLSLSAEKDSPLIFRTFRLSDGVRIDSLYVSHH